MGFSNDNLSERDNLTEEFANETVNVPVNLPRKATITNEVTPIADIKLTSPAITLLLRFLTNCLSYIVFQ